MYTSKIRNVFQLLGKVRTEENETAQTLPSKLQVTQNKVAHFMNGKYLLEQISAKEIFREQNMLSINQTNAHGKLSEIWKSLNIPVYPTR
jgi:hypothetical protein